MKMQIIEITKDNLKKAFKGNQFELQSVTEQSDAKDIVQDKVLIEILHYTMNETS